MLNMLNMLDARQGEFSHPAQLSCPATRYMEGLQSSDLNSSSDPSSDILDTVNLILSMYVHMHYACMSACETLRPG